MPETWSFLQLIQQQEHRGFVDEWITANCEFIHVRHPVVVVIRVAGIGNSIIVRVGVEFEEQTIILVPIVISGNSAHQDIISTLRAYVYGEMYTIYMGLQQNLWVNFGSGNTPKAWNKAIFSTSYLLNP